MFNWYNPSAPKNTITRYLSQRYTPEELANLPYLELPEQFESFDYSNELATILQDSPWKISEVKYKTSSLKSLKGIFTKDYWFGKNPATQAETQTKVEINSTPLANYVHENPLALLADQEEDNNSIKDFRTKVDSEATSESETSSLYSEASQELAWKDIHLDFTPELQTAWESNGFTYWQIKEWIDIGLQPTEADYAVWLKEQGKTPEWVLNYGNKEALTQAYQAYLTNPQPNNWWAKHQPWLIIAGATVLLIILWQE